MVALDDAHLAALGHGAHAGRVLHAWRIAATAQLAGHQQFPRARRRGLEFLRAVELGGERNRARAAGGEARDDRLVRSAGQGLALIRDAIFFVSDAHHGVVDVQQPAVRIRHGFIRATGGPGELQPQIAQRLVTAEGDVRPAAVAGAGSRAGEIIHHQFLRLRVFALLEQALDFGQHFVRVRAIRVLRRARPKRNFVQDEPFLADATQHHRAQAAVAQRQRLHEIRGRRGIPQAEAARRAGRGDNLDLRGDLRRFRLRFRQWQTFVHARALMPHRRQPRVFQHVLTLLRQLQYLATARGGIRQSLGVECSQIRRRRAPVAQDFPRLEPVAGGVHVYAIASQAVGGIEGAHRGQVLVHRRVGVHHVPTVGALRHEPGGVTIEHFIIAHVGLRICVAPGGQRAVFDGLRIEHRRGDQQQFGPAREDFFAQLADARLEFLKSLLAERIVNTVVHPVAGDNQFGL